ncbi:MAG: efflux RND transporter periplasmic adaptor subunit [Acidobacteriia bacterium]|nr:efflux RND transporter periplasmic adaptor subunit [Terriglobia bacterium]
MPVAVDVVRRGNMPVYINSIGTVTPVYTVTVTSRVVGELMEIHYKEGQIVKKGDLLAVIDPRPYNASYLQAEGQLARDQAQLNNARVDLQRYSMALSQRAIPEQTYATQQATVAQAEGTVKFDEGALEAAKVNVEYTRITAPIDGRVGLRQVDPGNIVQANGTTGLLTIAQLQPITVIFPMAEDYISDVEHAMRAGRSIRVDALDREDQHQLAQGTLLTLDNQVDTTTGTVRVRATFANKNNELFPNEFVNARLLVRTLSNVSIAPTAAIQRNGDQAFVYVVNRSNSTVELRDITVTDTTGNSAAVSGVKPGDTVVIDGFDRLENGAKVSIRPETATAPAAATASQSPATSSTRQAPTAVNGNTPQPRSVPQK